MTDDKFLLLYRNPNNNLTVCKQMRKSKKNDILPAYLCQTELFE